MHHKKQHWIPRSYLKAWCDPNSTRPDPYVWCFSKDGTQAKRRAPQNLFYEGDLYTIHLPDGSRDLTLEHGLASLEDSFVSIRDGHLAKRDVLAPADDLLLRAFVAAMKSRTPGHLQHMQDQFKTILKQFEAREQRLDEMSQSNHSNMMMGLGPVDPSMSMGMDELRKLAEGPVAPMIYDEVQVQLPALAQMHMAVLCNDDPLGFITSDMPCAWHDPRAFERPWPLNAVGLGWKTIEITLPISPQQLVILNWQGVEGYIDITVGQLDELNRTTRWMCDEYFVVRRNEKREIWFDPGKPPDREP